MDASRRGFLRGQVHTPPPPRLQVASTCLNRQGVECRLCGDACEARALRFRPAPGGISALVVSPEACTACGDCVPLCPVGAIQVQAGEA